MSKRIYFLEMNVLALGEIVVDRETSGGFYEAETGSFYPKSTAFRKYFRDRTTALKFKRDYLESEIRVLYRSVQNLKEELAGTKVALRKVELGRPIRITAIERINEVRNVKA